ncbi:MAG: aminotransferase class III-fold pyridoxal phosphate-dependent enzyme, partial [Gaiellaceae bacterium]
MSVLDTQPPRFTAEEVARIAAEVFGIAGTATDLGSERDQTFLIEDGAAGAVLKISNLGEDPAVLDLEHAAIEHVARVAPDLPVARPRGERATFTGPDGIHHVRLFERLHGRRGGGSSLDDRAVHACAATHARLNLALRSFFHPAAGRELLWNLEHTPKLRPLLAAIEDTGRRGLVARVVDGFERRVVPRWPLLRGQVVHGDFTLGNVLRDEGDRISAIFDFGDCAFTAQVADFAIALASLLRGRPGDDVFRVARIAIDGYASRLAFERDELAVLGDLVAARLAMIVAISAWRARRYPENTEYIQAEDEDSWALLGLFDAMDADAVAHELGAPSPAAATQELARRRSAALGALLTPLTYSRPVHAVRGEGLWLYEADGNRLLDAYNNVPVVGHSHPRVTEAVVRQTRLLNTHARYLYEPLVELSERLIASMPPEAGFDTVMLVNSGSEANDVAWRIATAATGRRGAIVTEHAYHGVTGAIADLSPEEWPPDHRPAHVARIPPPGSGVDVARELERAVGELDGLAATFLDGGLTSDGIWTPTSEELATVARYTRDAGGLFVADEVQAGYGRLGEHLWSFAHDGISPDIVTLGKPMGNGYPVAALVTRRELVDRSPFAGRLFSTFGGNPVAARAALAVLDVIEDERLVAHAKHVGEGLIAALRDLQSPQVAEVRGRGLLIGVQLTGPELAARVVDDLRDAGILIGRTGPGDDVLKIRPPLVFDEEHGAMLVEGLRRLL